MFCASSGNSTPCQASWASCCLCCCAPQIIVWRARGQHSHCSFWWRPHQWPTGRSWCSAVDILHFPTHCKGITSDSLRVCRWFQPQHWVRKREIHFRHLPRIIPFGRCSVPSLLDCRSPIVDTFPLHSATIREMRDQVAHQYPVAADPPWRQRKMRLYLPGDSPRTVRIYG